MGTEQSIEAQIDLDDFRQSINQITNLKTSDEIKIKTIDIMLNELFKCIKTTHINKTHDERNQIRYNFMKNILSNLDNKFLFATSVNKFISKPLRNAISSKLNQTNIRDLREQIDSEIGVSIDVIKYVYAIRCAKDAIVNKMLNQFSNTNFKGYTDINTIALDLKELLSLYNLNISAELKIQSKKNKKSKRSKKSRKKKCN